MKEIKFVVLRPSRTRVPAEGTVALCRAYALIKVHFLSKNGINPFYRLSRL